MAAELFKPFIIRKLIERGIVKTVKSAKKLVDRKDSGDLGHPRKYPEGPPGFAQPCPDAAPVIYPGIPAKLIEGKAIQLAPARLYCVQRRL
jgi:DNA-directed RNA polymerase subunit beta'